MLTMTRFAQRGSSVAALANQTPALPAPGTTITDGDG
jgi:hypothetical protein